MVEEAKKVENRIAYVISNYDYERYDKNYADLPGAEKDGLMMQALLLSKCGFKVYYHENIGKEEFDSLELEIQERSIATRKKNQYLVFFLYYAGHGISQQGGNVEAITIEKKSRKTDKFDLSEVIMNLSG